MSHKSTSKPSPRSYSAETSSTGGNNHRGTTTYSSSSHASTTEYDSYQRFLVSGTPSGRGAASASRQLNQWDRDFAAAASRR